MEREEYIKTVKVAFPEILAGRPYGTFIDIEYTRNSRMSDDGNSFDHWVNAFWGLNQNGKYMRRGTFSHSGLAIKF